MRRALAGSPRAAARLLAGAGLALAAACAPAAAPTPAPGPAPAPAPAPTPAPGAPALPSREPLLRVGLAVDSAAVRIGAPGGGWLETAGGQVLGELRPGAQIVLTPGAGGTADAAPAATDSSGFAARRGLPLPLVVRPREGALVRLGSAPYRGALLVRLGRAGRLTAINQVELEDYLLGVVPREIGNVGPELIEAAKAQAVAARTYAVKYLGRRDSLGFDVFATVDDQVYGGAAAESTPISDAVRQTAGEILTYRGAPIEAYYHSTCAGQTAAIEEVWNAAPVPYLTSIIDVNPQTGEAFDRSSSRFQWTERWTAPQLAAILSRTLADSLPRGVKAINEIRDMRVLKKTASGRVSALRIDTDAGSFTVGGDRVRWILVPTRGGILNSAKFDIDVMRDASGRAQEIVALGGGWGHGIGMCQVGAMGRARAGQDYRTILKAYYPGTELRRLY